MKIRTLVTLGALLVFAEMQGQTFYAMDSIQAIYITFSQSNWDYQMDTAKAGDESYIVASQVQINDQTFYDVGVRYKGNSTYSANNNKNPLHIELDHINTTQSYQGYTDIKLSNVWSDPSFIREVLAYEIVRTYMDAPQSNYAMVYINGNVYGLFVSSEAIGSNFCSNHFYSGNNALIKGNPVGGAGGGPGSSQTLPDLKYYGTAESSYNTRYELKSDTGWSNLIHLCDTLQNYTADIEKILDVDRALWMLAFNDVFVNLDSYTGSFKQNYYLYYDNNYRFNPVIWDLNMCFGSFTMLGGSSGGQGGLSATQMAQLTLFPHSTDTNWPLIYYLMQNTRYKKMYLAHVRIMIQEQLVSGNLSSRANELHDFVSDSVYADTNKPYTNAQFESNIQSSVTTSGGGPGGGSIVGVIDLMSSRLTYLQSTSDYLLVGPDITNVSAENSTPLFGETVWIKANINNANYAYLGYRLNEEKVFVKTEMFDDGAHHDGASGDGVYGASFVINTALAQYYIYAENTDAGKFSPQRAEHEYYSIEAEVAEMITGSVVINEFVASNQTGATDTDGQHDDWIELYNTTSNDINLFGTFLSDDPANPTKWAFPADALIEANGYLTIWADENGGQSGLHSNFKLSASGESVLFSKQNGEVMDQATFAAQTADRSVARCENGSGTFTVNVIPTFGAYNTCIVGVEENSSEDILLYPNPADNQLNILLNSHEYTYVKIINSTGALVKSETIRSTSLTLDVSEFAAGMYFVQLIKVETTHSFPILISR